MKKIICLVLSLCLMTPVFAVAFSDLTGYSWAETAIGEMAKKGIINGIGNNQFDPEGNVTYEQLAKMVTLGFKLDMTLPNNPTYMDVDEERWSYPYVETAKQLFGVTGEQFSPEAFMTRYEVVKVITSAVINGNTEGFVDVEFADGDTMTEDMKKWASIAANLGITQGYPDTTFRPNQKVSRAETAVMLSRAMSKALPNATPAATLSPEATPSPEVTPTPEATPIPEETPAPPEELKARMDFFVVTSVVRVAVDGGETTKVTGYDEGMEVSFTCEKAKVANGAGAVPDTSIAVGDVISAVRDINDVVRNIFILFHVDNVYDGLNVINPNLNVRIMSVGSMDYYYGLVRLHAGNSILLVYNDKYAPNQYQQEMVALNENTNIYEYNPDTKKVKLADKTDIMQDKTASENAYSDTGSFVYVRAVDSLAKDIYIINNKRQ